MQEFGLEEKLATMPNLRVSYHDPYVPAFDHDGLTMTCVPNLDAALQAVDCVLVVTDHSTYDWARIAQQARLVVDTRQALRRWRDAWRLLEEERSRS